MLTVLVDFFKYFFSKKYPVSSEIKDTRNYFPVLAATRLL